MILGIGVVILYALFVGWGLLSGNIPVERAYILLALLCLVPAIWYLSGFLRREDNDFGLVLSSLGWFVAALLLFWKHLATSAALANGTRLDEVPDSPASWFFAFLSIAAMLGGAYVSARYWMDKNAA